MKKGTFTFDETDPRKVLYEAAPELPFRDGVLPVHTKVVEYKSLDREPFILNTMSYLTNRMSVSLAVHGASPPPALHFEFLGGFDTTSVPDLKERSIHFEHPGWLFEDNGYFVTWWWTDGRPKVHA